MAHVQTVLGPVAPGEVGRILHHEHLLSLTPGPWLSGGRRGRPGAAGRFPGDPEDAQYAEDQVACAVRALSALHIEAMRLDHPVREADDRGRMERFVPLTQEGTDATTMANSRTTDLDAALAELPARDAKVLRLYFGLDDGKTRTLEEIGRMMGVTRERIRQLRDRALRQLREEHGDKLRDLAA